MAKQQQLFDATRGIHYYPLKFKVNEMLPHIYEAPIQADDQDIANPFECYHVVIEKERSGKWFIYAVDNEPCDFDQSVFKSLKEAKEFLQDWALSWIWCEMMSKAYPEPEGIYLGSESE